MAVKCYIGSPNQVAHPIAKLIMLYLSASDTKLFYNSQALLILIHFLIFAIPLNLVVGGALPRSPFARKGIAPAPARSEILGGLGAVNRPTTPPVIRPKIH